MLIFKRKTAWGEKEQKFYSKLLNVVVTYSESSYVNEKIWMREVVDKQVVAELTKRFGRDWVKQFYLLVSDTQSVLDHCARSFILPVFTPPNCTPFWSLIDDFTGAALRRIVYRKAEEFEMDYFETNPNGDGAIDAGKRRMLLAQWWNEAFVEGQGLQEQRINAAKRCGLYTTHQMPADRSYFPCPVRFKGTAYEHFGESLYDRTSPDFGNEKKYDFAFPFKEVRKEISEDQAHDEDGFSQEALLVVKETEVAPVNEDEEDLGEDGEEDDEGEIEVALFAKRAAERKQHDKKMVAQFEDLKRAELAGKKARKQPGRRKQLRKKNKRS